VTSKTTTNVFIQIIVLSTALEDDLIMSGIQLRLAGLCLWMSSCLTAHQHKIGYLVLSMVERWTRITFIRHV